MNVINVPLVDRSERVFPVDAPVSGSRWIPRGLRVRDEHLRRLLASMTDGIVVIDADGRIRFINPAARALLRHGSSVRSVTRLPLELEDGETMQLEIDLPDGQARVVEVRCTSLSWDGEDAFLVTLRDVTALNEQQVLLIAAREKAEELVRQMTTLLADVSHELRTPLAGMLGFAELLMQQAADEQHREFASLFVRAGGRLVETLDSVLAADRLERSMFEITSEPVSVREVVQEVATLLQPLAWKKGLALRVRLPGEEVETVADKIPLHRILNNLVGNAIKYTDRGWIEVDAEPADGRVQLRIRDTGRGISPAFLPRLFDAFSREADGEGSGLGLAITKRLVVAMGGTIDVESEVGKGTTFTVTLPLAGDAEGRDEAMHQPSVTAA